MSEKSIFTHPDRETEIYGLDTLLFGHYSGKGQWLNSLDVDLAWARITFLEAAK